MNIVDQNLSVITHALLPPNRKD